MADKFDVYFQVIPKAQYVGSKFFAFGPTRSIGVRGIQKLINLFTKYLMTPLGSDPLDLEAGTEVPALLGSNVTPVDAKDIILLAVDKTAKAIDAMQASLDVPDDERISTASVTKFITFDSGPGVAAQIFIQNVEGQGLEFLIPTLTART